MTTPDREVNPRGETDTVLLVDGRVDLPTRRVTRPGGSGRLTTLEARVLVWLVERAGETVTREMLLEGVWGYRPGVESRAADQVIWRLRNKLEENPREPVHVLTVHGEGYTWSAGPAMSGRSEVRQSALASLAEQPLWRDAFVGRDAELQRLEQVFAGDGDVQMVVLRGPGGVGKSRLSDEFSRRWPTRVVTCELADATSETDLVEVVAQRLDLTLPSGANRDVVRRVLGAALAEVAGGLVVFDNVEQAVAPFVALARVWLAHAPKTRFLVTTRRTLALTDVANWVEIALAPLSEDAAVSLFQRRVEESMRRRLAALRGQEDPMRALVNAIDRLPLAIELAAARSDIMSPTTMLDHVQSRFRLLAERTAAIPSARPKRHRALRHTIAWSWDLLSPPERATLAQLAVFRGGFALEAAEAVVALDSNDAWVPDTVSALVDASLLKLGAGSDEGRFVLLESIGDFAAEQLTGEARAAAIARHRVYFRQAATAALGGRTRSDVVSASTWLTRELANLLAALRRAVDAAAWQDATQLALAVEPLLARRGPFERHLEVLDLAVDAADADRDPLVGVEARLRRGAAWRTAGDLAAAHRDLEWVEAALQGLDNPSLETRAMMLAGQIARHDDPKQAAAYFDAAVATGRASGEPVTLADALRERGTQAMEQKRFDPARQDYEAALAIYQRLDDEVASAWVVNRLATVMLELGALAKAAALFRESLEAHERLGDRRAMAVTLSNLAVLLHEQGQLEESDETWVEASEIHAGLGNRRFVGFGLAGRGLIALERGDLTGAIAGLRRARRVFDETGDTLFAGITETRLGACYLAAGDAIAAETAFAAAQQRFDGIGADWASAALIGYRRLGEALRWRANVGCGEKPPPPAPASVSESSFDRLVRCILTRVLASAE